jgi:hypothetical protein
MLQREQNHMFMTTMMALLNPKKREDEDKL